MILKWRGEADQAPQGRIKGAKPVAVLDIGSNSVRLVVYERHTRALTPLYNEKASCALGRGVSATGRLADENTTRAIKAVRRFALVSKLMNVGDVYILATSAVRDAENGPEFAAEVQRLMGTPVRVLTGVEEAHFAALGVVAGMPAFSGVVGDLGGGSLELSVVESGSDFEGETHELGVIRVQDDSDNSPKRTAELVKKRLEGSAVIGAVATGRTFCAIGGTWRSIAKLHQRRMDYPLHMIQHYAAKSSDIIALCQDVVDSFEKDGTYEGAEYMSSSRRGLVPYGAAVLAETLVAGGFSTVCFSALGVREGYLFGQLDENEQSVDPLMQACEEMSVLRSRAPGHAHDLIEFSSKFITAAGLAENSDETRMREAVCLLADIGWRGHPDYRGEQSVDLVAYGALVGIDHPGRAFLSEALAVRYMGLKHKSVSTALFKLAGKKASARARTLGALLRVAYPMSAGMQGVLPKVGFGAQGKTLILQLPSEFAFLDGERLSSRLSQLTGTTDFEAARVDIT